MRIKQNVSLKEHSTMRLGGDADALVTVRSDVELVKAVEWANSKNKPIIIIGEGSNIVWQDAGFKGLVIVNAIRGFKKQAEDEDSATYRIGAGEEWDTVVKRLTKRDLSGVECLSLIPGKAGATPVQNVGAYGQEIAETLQTVDAYDLTAKKMVVIKNKDCGFDYRTSRFKTSDKGRFLITHITLKLRKQKLSPPFYAALEAYLETHKITDYSPMSIRKAVIAIRSAKLPDWHKVANNGSFFANPIIPAKTFKNLQKQFPDIVGWEHEGEYKVAAGWLVENVGLKGFYDPETGMATSEKQALVLINKRAHSTADLLRFKQKIVDAVQEKFGITLEQEPELIA